MATQKETVILDFQFDSKKAEKNIISLEKQIIKNKAELRELNRSLNDLNKSYQKGEISLEEYSKSLDKHSQASVQLKTETSKLQKEQRDLKKNIELVTKVENANRNSKEKLKAEVALLSKELEKMEGSLKINEDGTRELSEEYIKQSSALKQAREGLRAYDQAQGVTASGVGNYKEAITQALEEMNLFGFSLSGFRDKFANIQAGIPIAKTLFGTIRAGIISTGIGVFLIAIGSLIAFFQKSQRGADQLRKATAALGQVFNEVLGVVVRFGGFLVDTFTKVSARIDKFTGKVGLLNKVLGFTTRVFTGLALVDLFKGDEIDENAKAAARLEGQLIKIERAQDKINLKNAESLREQEKLKNIRDDEQRSEQVRLKANEKLGKILVKNLQDNLKQEQAKLKVLEDQLALKPEILRADEDLRKINDQRIVIAEKEEEILGRQNEFITNRFQIEKEINEKVLRQRTALLEQELLGVKEGSAKSFEIRRKQIVESYDLQIQSAKGANEEIKALEAEKNLELARLNKEQLDSQKENYREYIENKKEQDRLEQEKKNRDSIAGLNLDIAQLEELAKKEQEANENSIKAVQDGNATKADLTFSARKALLKKQKELLDQELEQELQNKDLSEKERLFLDYQYYQKKQQLDADFYEQQANLNLQGEIAVTESIKNEQERRLGIKLLQKQNELAQVRAGSEEELQLLFELETIKQEQEQELLRQKLENKEITEQEYELLREQNRQQHLLNMDEKQRAFDQQQIDNEQRLQQARIDIANSFVDTLEGLADQESAIAKAAFLFKKSLALIEIGLNLQNELSNISRNASQFPEPLATITRVVKIAQAVARGAKVIAEVKSLKFEQGGEVVGASHAQGGVKGIVKSTGQEIEVEGNEAIIKKESAQKPQFKPLLSAVNEFTGGTKFAANSDKYKPLVNALANGFTPKFRLGGDLSTATRSITNTVINNNNVSESIRDIADIIPQIRPVLQLTELKERQSNITFSENIAAS